MIVLAGALVLGSPSTPACTRRGADATLKRATEEAATATVQVVSPTPATPPTEILLPGTTQAFTDAPIFARTSGYLKRWYFDIGAHVKQGQLLAEIETPEVDQQLRQARAELAARPPTCDRPRSPRTAGGPCSRATRSRARRRTRRAHAHRHEGHRGLQRRERPPARAAPGVPEDLCTVRRRHHRAQHRHRGPDRRGGEHGPRALPHGGHPHAPRLRRGAPGDTRELPRSRRVDRPHPRRVPGQVYHGTLVRTANAIDLASRTLRAKSRWTIRAASSCPAPTCSSPRVLRPAVATIPANTLLFRAEGLQVAVVRDGRAQLVPVTIGRDYGTHRRDHHRPQAGRPGHRRPVDSAGQRNRRPRPPERVEEGG